MFWFVLEKEACATPATSVESLKKQLVKAWSKIDQKIFHAVVDEFPCRLKAIINSKGDHFELFPTSYSPAYIMINAFAKKISLCYF